MRHDLHWRGAGAVGGSAVLSAVGPTLPVHGHPLAFWRLDNSVHFARTDRSARSRRVLAGRPPNLEAPRVDGEVKNPEESGQARRRTLPDTSGFGWLRISRGKCPGSVPRGVPVHDFPEDPRRGRGRRRDATERLGFQSGIDRCMDSSNVGTVNAVSPCCGQYTMPFRMRPPRGGAAVVTPMRSFCPPAHFAVSPAFPGALSLLACGANPTAASASFDAGCSRHVRPAASGELRQRLGVQPQEHQPAARRHAPGPVSRVRPHR